MLGIVFDPTTQLLFCFGLVHQPAGICDTDIVLDTSVSHVLEIGYSVGCGVSNTVTILVSAICFGYPV